MQENDIFEEITSHIINKSNLQEDIAEAVSLVSQLFKNKYIDKLQQGLNHHINLAKKNPTKEIVLLQAIKPFLKENSHENIDSFINTLNHVSILSGLRDKFFIQNKDDITKESVKLNSKDESIKEDGIYDIDENCLISSQSISSNNIDFMVFVILFIFLKNLL